MGGGSFVSIVIYKVKVIAVYIISLTETNFHWKRNHIISRFKIIFNETWSKNKITICTSESEIAWNVDYKLGGTATVSGNILSSVIIAKGQDPSRGKMELIR